MKKSIIPSVLACVLIFSACHKTPYTTVINNITPENNFIQTESLSNLDNSTEISIIDYELSETLELENINVTLRGVARKPNSYEGLCVYFADVINYNEYESNMTFLFGEYEDVMYRNGKQLTASSEEWLGYSAYIVNSSLCDENNFTGIWGSIAYIKVTTPLADEERRVNMTNEDAKIESDEILNKIGVDNFYFESCMYYEEIINEGFSPMGDELTVKYIQKIQGVPLKSTLINGRCNPFLSVKFDSKGVRSVGISEYKVEPYTSIDKCLTYEEALVKFEKYMSRNSSYDGVVFDEVAFEYTIVKEYFEGELITMAVPHWHFYADDMYYNVKDIYVNCIDGTIVEK